MKLNLKSINPLERDKDVELHPNYDENHIYLIKGISHKDLGFKSVTTYIADLGDKFDPDKILDRWELKNDPRLKGTTREEIKKEWIQNGEEKAKLGTFMHLQIENYFNNEEVHEIGDLRGFRKYLENKELNPFRTELTIYDEDLKLVGNVDLIVKNSDGTYDIIDWKRKKDLSFESYNKTFKYPLNTLPYSEGSKYALQLSLYKYLLEKNYNMKINKLWNVCIEGGWHKVYEQPYMIEAINKIINSTLK